MSFEYLFEPKTSQLIEEYQKIDLDKAILKLHNHEHKLQIINQLDGKNRIKSKLPTWNKHQKIVYPPKINLEQCSSEIAAKYKSEIVSGKHLIDLTGGFGVDSYYFSKCFESVDYVEQNADLIEIVKWNFSQFNTQNIILHNKNCAEFLANFKPSFPKNETVFYIDPARRNETNQKLVQFADCEPNIIELIPKLFTHSDTIIVKSSPMHDINLALEELKYVYKLHIVSIKNECKELLFVLSNNPKVGVEIVTINIDKVVQKYNFNYNDINTYHSEFSDVKKYISEPNNSVMKSGAFKVILKDFEVQKIAANTHLYTSNEIISSFPGKTFEVVREIKLNNKEIKTYIPDNQINIISRNYIYSTNEVKKIFKLKDGGQYFLICFKDKNQLPKSYICEQKIFIIS